MTARKKTKEPRDIFFSSAAKATLSSVKGGKMENGVVTALVKNGDEYGLIAIPLPSGVVDVEMASEFIESALSPVVKYVSGPDRRLIAFSVGLQGEGHTQKGVETPKATRVVIVGVRTEENIGRTAVFRNTGGDFEVIETKEGDSEEWCSFPEDTDLPGFVAQTILQSLWTNYVTIKNMSFLNHA